MTTALGISPCDLGVVPRANVRHGELGMYRLHTKSLFTRWIYLIDYLTWRPPSRIDRAHGLSRYAIKQNKILNRLLAGVTAFALIVGINVSTAQAVGSTNPSVTPSAIMPASSDALTVSFTASTGGTTANWGADVIFETPAFTIPAPATYELVDTFNNLAVRGVSGSVITCNLGGTQVTWTSQLLAARVLAASYAACNRDVYAGNGVVVYGIYISMPGGSTFSISNPEQISLAIGAGGLAAPSTERNYDYGAYTYQTGTQFVILDEGYASIAVSQNAPTPTPEPEPSPVVPATSEKVTLTLDAKCVRVYQKRGNAQGMADQRRAKYLRARSFRELDCS